MYTIGYSNGRERQWYASCTASHEVQKSPSFGTCVSDVLVCREVIVDDVATAIRRHYYIQATKDYVASSTSDNNNTMSLTANTQSSSSSLSSFSSSAPLRSTLDDRRNNPNLGIGLPPTVYSKENSPSKNEAISDAIVYFFSTLRMYGVQDDWSRPTYVPTKWTFRII